MIGIREIKLPYHIKNFKITKNEETIINDIKVWNTFNGFNSLSMITGAYAKTIIYNRIALKTKFH